MPYEGTVTGLNLPEGIRRIETGIVVLRNRDGLKLPEGLGLIETGIIVLRNRDGFEVAGGTWTD